MLSLIKFKPVQFFPGTTTPYPIVFCVGNSTLSDYVGTRRDTSVQKISLSGIAVGTLSNESLSSGCFWKTQIYH